MSRSRMRRREFDQIRVRAAPADNKATCHSWRQMESKKILFRF